MFCTWSSPSARCKSWGLMVWVGTRANPGVRYVTQARGIEAAENVLKSGLIWWSVWRLRVWMAEKGCESGADADLLLIVPVWQGVEDVVIEVHRVHRLRAILSPLSVGCRLAAERSAWP